MHDCKLLKVCEIPGTLYDTGRGYPAAVFNEESGNNILGELFIMDNPDNKLEELDSIEAVDTKLFKRVEMTFKGINFYSYEPGPVLEDSIISQNKITEGNWRRFSSLCFHDPISFALNCEDRQKYLYRDQVSEDADGLIYIKGDLPLMITAPHSSVHKRMGKLKRQEFYTGALSVLLHSLTGCHVLYTNRLMESDPNYYDESPFKNKLSEITNNNEIKFLLDLHGTGPEKEYDLYPGIGINKKFLLGQDIFLQEFQHISDSSNILIGGLDVFPAAKQMTVTKYAAMKLNIPAMQLEINRNLRDPEKEPEQFIKLVKFLKEYVDALSNLVS